MTTEEPVPAEELSSSTCWELMRSTSVARLAVIVDGRPDIFPINYSVDRGSIVFRTAEGTKLTAALSCTPVALEADGYSPAMNRAWSVVLHGTAESIQQTQELLDTTSLPLVPWHPGAKEHFVRIEAAAISGRRFTVAAQGTEATTGLGPRQTSFD